MDGTKEAQAFGQSLWLDDITRGLLDSGTLERYIDESAITGLTSNPTIFAQAIAGSDAYDDEIKRLSATGLEPEALFFELAIQDLARAADVFTPIHHQTATVDGWVSLEVSPTLAYDAERTLAEARALFQKAKRPNLFIKIPGTTPGVTAIEEAVFAAVPVNVTLLFSPDQYRAAAEAYMRGLERRLAAGLDADVRSVASIFVSRWDKATADGVSERLRNRLGIAVATQTYVAYRDLMETDRWQTLASAGARPQRLLFASTGTKDPAASDVLYLESLVAPNTVNTVPQPTLHAFADHGRIKSTLPRDGGDSAAILAQFTEAGIDVDALALQLQEDGARAFADSWKDLCGSIAAKAST